MTAVRFFTSAALRPQEEVDGEIVPWLPRSITVEYDGDHPVTGVWQSSDGARRVCWYRGPHDADLRAMHDERYGDEPYWIVALDGGAGGRVVVEEHAGDGTLLGHRRWDFDRHAMPVAEEELEPDGTVRARRRYKCFTTGHVVEKHEELPPVFASVELPRQRSTSHPFPIPELAGEPFPCGGTVGAARLVSVIWQNFHQGRYGAVLRTATGWTPGIATLVVMGREWSKRQLRVLALEDPGLAPVLLRGVLEDRRQTNFKMWGAVEATPPGVTLESLMAAAPIPATEAVALARQIGEVALRVHAQGLELEAIRPELIYVHAAPGKLELTGIQHCAPMVVAATYAGEAIVWPPVFPQDFSSADDVSGLAQLVWYMTTRTHPELPSENLRWQPSWGDFRHERRQRQPWTGPAALGRVLEGALFPAGARPTLQAFLSDLAGCVR